MKEENSQPSKHLERKLDKVINLIRYMKNYPTPNQTQNPQETLPLTIHPS
jgi:hypothetical protein